MAMRLAIMFMVLVIVIVIPMPMLMGVLNPIEMVMHVQVGLIGVLVLVLIDAHARPFAA